MSINYPNNDHEKRPSPSRRTLLRWGLAGGTVVAVGGISTLWWSSLFRPSRPITIYTYPGHASGVSSVAWSPDGTRIASVGWDQTIQVWNAKDGHHLLTYRGHPDALKIAWSPDSTRLASAGNHFTVQVWNASNGQQIWTHQDSPNISAAFIAWSPDGTRIATSGASNKGSIQVRNASDGQLILNYQGHPYSQSLAWSPDSTRIASGGTDRSVQVWRVLNGQKIWFYQIPDQDLRGEDINMVNAIAWSSDGKHIVSGGSCPSILFANNGGIQMWNASTGQRSWTYWGHDRRSDITAVTWSPDGKQIASGATDKTVQVWSATNGNKILTYQEHTDKVKTVAWSPDGTRIVSGGWDRLVRVWRVL